MAEQLLPQTVTVICKARKSPITTVKNIPTPLAVENMSLTSCFRTLRPNRYIDMDGLHHGYFHAKRKAQ